MKLFISMILFFALLPNNAYSSLAKPTEGDTKSTCLVILYKTTLAQKAEDIQVLTSAFNLLCKDQNFPEVEEYSNYFESIQNQNPNLPAACINMGGYVSSPSGRNGWNHKEIENYKNYVNETKGGFNHKEIQDIMKIRQFLGKFEENDLSQFMKMKSKGITVEDFENANIIYNMKKFNTIRPQLMDLNNRFESLGVGSQLGQ
jgi:hypothetical protein